MAKAASLIGVLCAVLVSPALAQVDVTVDSSVKYQTIEGWGHGSAFLGAGWSSIDSVGVQYIDFLADDWGLTGTRLNEIGARLDGSGMDHGDCDSIDWSLFSAPTNRSIFTLMQRFRDRVRAQGFEPSFYSSTNYAQLAAIQKPWILNHPGERAQEMWASAQYYRDSLGIDTRYAVIANEPSGSWTAQIIADVIKAAGPRFLSRGLATQSQFPECVAAQTAWQYITAVRSDTELWPWIGRISYHNYGTADPYRSYIRDFGDSLHTMTAQTEMDPANIDNLFDDLLKGGVSYWEVAYTNASTVNPNAGYTSFAPTRYYYRVRQVLHYVRPDAVRIRTTSTDTLVRVLSFVRNGANTTIVYNTASSPRTVTVHGIPQGRYGLSQALSGVIAYEEHGVQTIGSDESLSITIPAYADATLYPYAGTNLPPTLMTWGSTPGVLSAPATTASLAVTANDPEMDSLHFAWSVVSQPSGAAAVLATPNKATTGVSGLTAGGSYVFNVDVTDGINTVSRKSYLIVYASNQPPQLGATGFRLASPYGVILDGPMPGGVPLRTIISLPAGTEILQANVSDLENDALTGLWTMVSQPSGGTASVDSTISIFASFRCHILNITTPGEYVFQISVSDGKHPAITAQVILSVQQANTWPVITAITATPDTVAPAIATVGLNAATTDAEHDLLRYWWVIKSAPLGAHPVFDHQGRASTAVSGLTVPGTYYFTLRTFDDISMTTKDVRVVVRNATGVESFSRAIPTSITLGQSIPNPATASAMIPFALTRDGFVTLALFDCLGREVATLIHAQRPAGAQQAECNLDGLRSGIYSYRLIAGGSTAAGSMIVVR